MPTSAELLQRTAAGDQDAWGLLAERHLSALRAVTSAICGDSDLAEDAVQEAFLRIRSGANGFRVRSDDPEGDARRWIKRVAANCAIDQLRERRRRKSQALADLPAKPPDEGETPAAAVARAMDKLAAPARAAIELRYHDGLDGSALATALGISPVAARVRLHRALTLLRRQLSAEGVMLAPALLVALIPAPASATEPVAEAAYGVSPLPHPVLIGAAMLTAAAIVVCSALAWSLPDRPAPPASATQVETPAAPPRPPSEPTAIMVEGVAWSSHAVWSPDGRTVVFAKALEPGQQAGDLRAIEVPSGIERSLGRIPYPDPIPDADEADHSPQRPSFASRAAMVMDPLAVSAGVEVVWLDCRKQGLWSWRPTDRRLIQHHPSLPLSQPGRFSAAPVATGGPHGMVAFVDRNSNRLALGEPSGPEVTWLKLPRIAGHYMDTVLWRQGRLTDFKRDGTMRQLWPEQPAAGAPTVWAPFTTGAVQAEEWDFARGERLTSTIPDGMNQPLDLPTIRTMALRLSDAADTERWHRQIGIADILGRLRSAAAEERAHPKQDPKQARASVNETAQVVAFNHPHALIRVSLEVRYGFFGSVFTAFVRYDIAADRLTALGDGVYPWESWGVRKEYGTLPDCSPSPDAAGVAFRAGGRLYILR